MAAHTGLLAPQPTISIIGPALFAPGDIITIPCSPELGYKAISYKVVHVGYEAMTVTGYRPGKSMTVVRGKRDS